MGAREGMWELGKRRDEISNYDFMIWLQLVTTPHCKPNKGKRRTGEGGSMWEGTGEGGVVWEGTGEEGAVWEGTGEGGVVWEGTGEGEVVWEGTGEGRCWGRHVVRRRLGRVGKTGATHPWLVKNEKWRGGTKSLKVIISMALSSSLNTCATWLWVSSHQSTPWRSERSLSLHVT